MNQKNLDYLSDQLKYTGFGEELQNNLKEKMQQGAAEFDLVHRTKFGNDAVAAVLHFKKSNESDMYFFNKYDVAIAKENGIGSTEQTFYINSKGSSITLKEAYNLMSGRAVNKDLINKEGRTYNAWLQMDFKQTESNGNYKLKQYHQHYGYDLEKELAKHPIRELSNQQDKTKLIESLNKGNRQSVTFMKDGNEQKYFIEANPQFKTVNLYDSNMQRVQRHAQKEKNTTGQSIGREAKKESQNECDMDDTSEIPKTSNKRKKNQSKSIH